VVLWLRKLLVRGENKHEREWVGVNVVITLWGVSDGPNIIIVDFLLFSLLFFFLFLPSNWLLFVPVSLPFICNLNYSPFASIKTAGTLTHIDTRDTNILGVAVPHVECSYCQF
jgi:hypothetical protein